jgi:hypothetical protein
MEFLDRNDAAGINPLNPNSAPGVRRLRSVSQPIRFLYWAANSRELCRLAEGLTRNQIE